MNRITRSLTLATFALAACAVPVRAQARAAPRSARPAPARAATPPVAPRAVHAVAAPTPAAASPPVDTAAARRARIAAARRRAARAAALDSARRAAPGRADWNSGLVHTPPPPPRPEAPDGEAPAAGALRLEAFRAPGMHLVVSLRDRRLWYLNGRDTVFTAPVAVGKGTRLEYGSRAWRFNTPRGVRRVLDKRPNPVWTPPDWHYAEIARDSGWALAHLERGRPVRLKDGGHLLVRGDRVVYQDAGGGEEIIPDDEEVIFDETMFIPPEDTRNRRITGELGAYALSLGDGYLLHGTPHKESIGQAATHGCIRLGDQAIEYLYRNVGVGTPVYIF